MTDIYDIGYIRPARDWLRVSRIPIYNGENINAPKLYIKNTDVLYVIPAFVRIFRDEKGLFVLAKDVKQWDEFDRFRRFFIRR